MKKKETNKKKAISAPRDLDTQKSPKGGGKKTNNTGGSSQITPISDTF